jgi:radical SAM protein (TIGR01212 family)
MPSQILYKDFSCFLKEYFNFKVQKISINAGFTCPNRDGTKGWGGCTYCNNQTFNPEYCKTFKSVTEQLEEGKVFFARKYPLMKYLAYFQAYTNTYGEIQELKKKYEEALAVKDVVGLVIGTRPDCMSDDLLDYLSQLNRKTFVLIEYGIESVYDKTLERINRGHTFADTKDAIERTALRGIPVGGHVILGLPGETHQEIIKEAAILSSLPLDILKLHQLQLIKRTCMAKEYMDAPNLFTHYNVDEYIDLVIDFLQALRSDITVERFVSQSPKQLLAVPGWGLKNYEFTAMVKKRMLEREAYQGKSF